MKLFAKILQIVVTVCLTSAAVGIFAADSVPGKPLGIQRITPAGEDVPAGRQIVIQFSRPVVPLGRVSRAPEEIPVEIDPALNCQWQWLNTSALACRLSESDALSPATHYEVRVLPGILAEDGQTTEAPYVHRFSTIRPRVDHAWFSTWKSPGTPVIHLSFNQPVTGESVARHIYFRPEGDGSVRYGIVAVPVPHEALEPGDEVDDPYPQDSPENGEPSARSSWRIFPARELPLAASMELRAEPGVVSSLGPEPGAEQRTVVRFDTFPEFRFLGVQCRTIQDVSVIIGPDEPPGQSPRCNPLGPVELLFSAPVTASETKRGVSFTPDLAGGRTDYDPWANVSDDSRLSEPHQRGQAYSVRVPERLAADRDYRIRIEAGKLLDELGRSLPGSVDMVFATDHRKPDFKVLHPTAVLESQVDSEAPLVVTNLESYRIDYERLTPRGEKEAGSLTRSLPAVPDIAYAVPMGVREMLAGSTGVVYGRIFPRPPVPQKSDYDRRFLAQVTPFQVHVKAGHFNTLVWVADLATGRGVPGASVAVYRDAVASLSARSPVLAQTQTDADGIGVLPGTERLDPGLEALAWRWRDDTHPRLMVRVEKDGQMALLPLEERFEADVYRASAFTVSRSGQTRYGHIHAWGTTAQGVYRAGDTIQYKIYVRNQDNERFVPSPEKSYTLRIMDPTGKAVHERRGISLSEFGAFHGEYTVARTGAVGWYDFSLSADFTEHTWLPMRVLVSDFTPAPFRVEITIEGSRFRTGDAVKVLTTARLHAGGPYTDASTRVTAMLDGRMFTSGNPLAKGFFFDTSMGEESRPVQVFQTAARLDDRGTLPCEFTMPETKIVYGRLTVESAVQDDRGKSVAALARAEYVGRDRFVGLKNTAWVYGEDEPAAIGFLVVDDTGEPVAGVPVELTVERLETRASRVKGAGNAYLTSYTDQWEAVESGASLSGAEPGEFFFTPNQPGDYRITAAVTDTAGRIHQSWIQAWVAGKGRVLWHEPEGGSLPIISERPGYRVGETARFLVKNPFPGASTLVSVERYGVIRHWVQVLETGTPIVEFPVEAQDLPGFYLSVIVLSPRVAKPPGEFHADLGKPTFRMGYAAVKVEDPDRRIRMSVTPEKPRYKPGEKVRVNLDTEAGSDGKPVELAVAVLDEAVFDLLRQGQSHFDPYGGFYRLDGLDLRNFSLLTRLVGLQKFEKKGANAGGGGGPDISLRSVFKFVAYWNPSLRPDAEGHARIEFEAPDNLTGWRVFAMAVTPGDRMGLGDGGFQVNRPTEIRPLMPNQVTQGDRFLAGFSVMNRTGKTREIAVSVRGTGTPLSEEKPAVHGETVTLPPFKRHTVWTEIKTERPGELRFEATAGDDSDRDAMVHTVPVHRARSLETMADYGAFTESRVEVGTAFPEDIHTDAGGLTVVAAPTVIGNVDGAFRYMKDYPYTCWEQRITKAIMADFYNRLKDYLPADFSWEQSGTLPQKTLIDAVNHQAPNGGMAYYIPENHYVSPYLSAYTALCFSWLKESGHMVPQGVEERLHGYLAELLRRDVLPDFYTAGMSATVRAVALCALSREKKIDLSDLTRHLPHVPYMSLFGMAHFLEAAVSLKAPESLRMEVADRILAHGEQSGGKFQFVETLEDGYSRILASPVRTNGAVLGALAALAQTPEGAGRAGDVPFKLVRAITQARGSRDHWENTQENVFCMKALADYSKVYEKQTPSMAVRVMLAGPEKSGVEPALLGEARFTDLRDDPATFQRPVTPRDPGTDARIVIERNGEGRLYYAARLSFASLHPDPKPVDAGIEIDREYSVERNGRWELLSSPMAVSRGELVRVDLFLSLPGARNFVVVSDPVPGGLEPVNRDLATASTIDARKGFQAAGGSRWLLFADWHAYRDSRWSFYHQELRHDAVRFYSDYLPPGRYHLSYTAQVIAAGRFAVLPVHAEEMYDPDVYGRGIREILEVRGE